MVMRRDGVHTGSVSGGCVEEDLVQRYRDQQLSENYPTLVDYGVNREDASRFGLPCGGRLELLIENNLDISILLYSKSKKTEFLLFIRTCFTIGAIVSKHQYKNICFYGTIPK